jgi:hypothetical protein
MTSIGAVKLSPPRALASPGARWTTLYAVEIAPPPARDEKGHVYIGPGAANRGLFRPEAASQTRRSRATTCRPALPTACSKSDETTKTLSGVRFSSCAALPGPHGCTPASRRASERTRLMALEQTMYAIRKSPIADLPWPQQGAAQFAGFGRELGIATNVRGRRFRSCRTAKLIGTRGERHV